MASATIFRAPDPLTYDTLQSMITNWKAWYKQFSIFLIATEYADKEDSIKVSMFLNLIGTQGNDLYESFTWNPESDHKVFKKVIEKFEEHMNKNKNVTVNRYAFFNNQQNEGQTIDDYIKELTILRKDCEFQTDGNINDSLLRDKIISGLCDKGLREKLLRLESDKSTLATVIATCRMHEISKDQSVLLDNNSDSTVNLIKQPSTHFSNKQGNRNYGNNNGDGYYGNNRNSNRRSSYNQTPRRTSNNKCRFCGLSHDFNAQCSAFGKRCGYCNKLNHFESVCFQKRRNIQQISFQQASNATDNSSDDQREVNQLSSSFNQNTLFMSRVRKELEHRKDWNATLKINNEKHVLFRVDSGADVSILSINEYRKLSKAPILENSNAKLCAYNRTSIAVLGKCQLVVQFEDNTARELEFQIAEYSSVLSGYHAEELKMIKRMFSIENLPTDIDTSIFEGLGCLKDSEIKLHIDKDYTPVIHAPRKVPHTIQDKLKAELDRMEAMEVIYPIKEPTEWVSSLVIVEKPDGKLRLCIDPKDLNKAIKRHHYPMRTAEDIFNKMASATIFSKLDCTSGYWQLKVDDESSRLLCFNTPFGRYCFKRLPFGIHIASEIFQQKVEDLFAGIDGVANAQDDIIIWGSNQNEHDARLQKTLDILKEAGLKLNREKCKFSVTELIFLGHKISKAGISPDPSKITAIKNMPLPENKQDVQRLLGVINYVGKFIPNLSSITAPLRKLIENDQEFLIKEEQSQALAKIKNILISDPVLKLFDPKRTTKIGADASKFGLGAVLMQKYDNDWLPVAYASRSLTKTEMKYAQIEKEALSTVFACSKFHQYVYGKSFVIENDHKPLQTIFKKDLSLMPPRIQRMMMALVRYPDLEVRYIPGSQLKIPDTLSRAPLKETESENQEDIDYQIHAVFNNLPATEEVKERFQRSTKADKITAQLLEFVDNGWPALHDCPSDVKHYWGFQDEITQIHDILYKGQRMIVPKDMRQYVKEKVHMGHLGIIKCQERAKTYFYWPGMNDEIKQVVETCGSCQKFRNRQPKQPNMQVTDDQPWGTVGSDIFHHNLKHYLIVTDYYSSYPEVIFLKQGRAHGTSKEVIEKMKTLFSQHGIPKVVISDGGPQFTAQDFKDFSKQWQFSHEPSSPYYPRGNGKVERSVQTVKQILKKAIDSKTDIQAALLAYRTTPLQDCNYSPAELLLNRNPRNHLNAHMDYYTTQPSDEIKKNRAPYSQKYTNQHSVELPELNPGDNVRIRTHKDSTWSIKGTVVSRHHTPRSYMVRTTDGKTYRRNRQQLLKTQEKWNVQPYSEYLDDDFIYVTAVRQEDDGGHNNIVQYSSDDTASESSILDSEAANEQHHSDDTASHEPITDVNNDNVIDLADTADEVITYIRIHYQNEDYRRYSTRVNLGKPPERYGFNC